MRITPVYYGKGWSHIAYESNLRYWKVSERRQHNLLNIQEANGRYWLVFKQRQRGAFNIKETNQSQLERYQATSTRLVNIQELRFPIVGLVIRYPKGISSTHALTILIFKCYRQYKTR